LTPGPARADVFAFITGHGFGTEPNCAEFCNHTHHFLFNETEYQRRHDHVDDPRQGPYDCMRRVEEGVVPNQWGSWIFGRGGWCPGQDVIPWVAEATEALDLSPDADNRVGYQGYFRGEQYLREPPPEPVGGAGGNIRMTSYLVFWR